MRFLSVLPLALLLAACGTVRIGERNFIHPDTAARAPDAPFDAAALLPAATVTQEQVTAADGAVLRGITVRQGSARRALLYFGGNAFHLDRDGPDIVPLLAACGLDVAVFDYRGYGRNRAGAAAPTVATLGEDAVRLYDHVLASHPDGVIVHGQSLGSFLAAHVVRARPAARALVLEATSTTVQAWADANIPWYGRLFLRIEVEPGLAAVDNVAAVASYPGAALVLAGARDTVTPWRHGRRVFDALPGAAKRWYLAEGANHNTILGAPGLAPVYCSFLQQE